MSQDAAFLTSRILPFSPAALYGAFASGEVLARWWGPKGFTNTFEVFEFKEGGRWRFVMHGPDGTHYPNECQFLTLALHARVVIRHTNAPLFTLSVDLVAAPEGTKLVWEQVFDDREFAQSVRTMVTEANEQNLDRLTQVLAT